MSRVSISRSGTMENRRIPRAGCARRPGRRSASDRRPVKRAGPREEGRDMKIASDRKVMLGLSTALILFTVCGAMIGRVVAVEGTYGYLKLFNEALYLIVHNYVQPVEIDSLMEGAYRGMLESLDPANEYLSPARYEKAYKNETGGPAGVGLNLSKRRGYIVVVSVTAGSPASEAGLQTGDVLVTIDGRSTRQLGIWEATQALSGKPGTKTTINISPAEAAGRKTIALTRRIIPPPAP